MEKVEGGVGGAIAGEESKGAPPVRTQVRPEVEMRRSYKEALAPHGEQDGYWTTDRHMPRAPQGVHCAVGGREMESDVRWLMEDLQSQIWKLQKEMADLRGMVGWNKEKGIRKEKEKEGLGLGKGLAQLENKGFVWRKVGPKGVSTGSQPLGHTEDTGKGLSDGPQLRA